MHFIFPAHNQEIIEANKNWIILLINIYYQPIYFIKWKVTLNRNSKVIILNLVWKLMVLYLVTFIIIIK